MRRRRRRLVFRNQTSSRGWRTRFHHSVRRWGTNRGRRNGLLVSFLGEADVGGGEGACNCKEGIEVDKPGRGAGTRKSRFGCIKPF